MAIWGCRGVRSAAYQNRAEMKTWELKVLGYMAGSVEGQPEWIAVSSFRRILREQAVFRPEAQDAILFAGRDAEVWQLTGWSEAHQYIAPEDWPQETIADENGFRFARVMLCYGPFGQRRGKWFFLSIRRMAEWRALGEAVSFV